MNATHINYSLAVRDLMSKMPGESVEKILAEQSIDSKFYAILDKDNRITSLPFVFAYEMNTGDISFFTVAAGERFRDAVLLLIRWAYVNNGAANALAILLCKSKCGLISLVDKQTKPQKP